MCPRTAANSDSRWTAGDTAVDGMAGGAGALRHDTCQKRGVQISNCSEAVPEEQHSNGKMDSVVCRWEREGNTLGKWGIVLDSGEADVCSLVGVGDRISQQGGRLAPEKEFPQCEWAVGRMEHDGEKKVCCEFDGRSARFSAFVMRPMTCQSFPSR